MCCITIYCQRLVQLVSACAEGPWISLCRVHSAAHAPASGQKAGRQPGWWLHSWRHEAWGWHGRISFVLQSRNLVVSWCNTGGYNEGMCVREGGGGKGGVCSASADLNSRVMCSLSECLDASGAKSAKGTHRLH